MTWLRTTERTFWCDENGGYRITGRTTQIHTRWFQLWIERPDNGPAWFWVYQRSYGVLTVPRALSRLGWYLRRKLFA